MIAEIIATGNEILRGRSLDTNTRFISNRLTRLGHTIRFHSAIGDRLEDLVAGFRLALRRAELVVVTGGLGPTADDLTRHAAAKAFHRPLRFDARVWEGLRRRARERRIRLPGISRRQACFPQGAEVIPNERGFAPGFLLRRSRRALLALSGVPREMEAMLDFGLDALGPPPAVHPRDCAFKICGIPESEVETRVRARLKRIRNLEYGITAGGVTVSLNLRAGGRDPGRTFERVRRLLRRTFGNAFFGEDDATIAGAVARRLQESRTTLAVAESCTGGRIVDRLTDVPGISEVLLEGLVTYSNESKRRRLGVKVTTLERHGAVSAETAKEMAEGVRRRSGADLGLSTTGIAGPTGGSGRKPVGLVYFAISDRHGTRTEKRLLSGGRLEIKDRAADLALFLLYNRLAAR